MALTLTIVNVERLDNGEPTRLILDRHGAIIGRSPHADWSLPDARREISATHCEIDFRDGGYVLVDKSTNGTFVNGSPERLAGPYAIRDGDEIVIGQYRVTARVGDAEAGARAPATPAPVPTSGWGDWEAPSVPAAAPGWGPAPTSTGAAGFGSPAGTEASPAWGAPSAPAPSGEFGAPPSAGASAGWGQAYLPPTADAPRWEAPDQTPGPGSAISGRGAMSQHWAPAKVETPPAASSDWGGGWGDSAPSPAPPASSVGAGDDPWAKLTGGNDVDWGRGFASPGPDPAPPAHGADLAWGAPPPSPSTVAGARDPFGLPVESVSGFAGSPLAAAAPQFRPQGPGPGVDTAWAAFLAAAGVGPGDLKGDTIQAARAAGEVLRRAIGGLVVMIEARARAKAQLGAQSTTLNLDGNNPLKFARNPERVIAQLLNPPERGFMSADRAITDSFQDLQAHQVATLAAMQGALRSTLARFSPDAIRKRAETRGLLAKILPGAREAEMWKAYEREFEGVAEGSAEAFMEVFSRAFKQAYEETSSSMKARG